MTAYVDRAARSKGEAMGRILSLMAGDLRDWPERCEWCKSEDVRPEEWNDHLRCTDCGKLTSRQVALADRLARAKSWPP